MATKFWRHIKANIKNNFLSGLVITVPLFITFVVLRAIFNFFDRLILPYLQIYLKTYIPGLGILLGLTFIYLVGMITKNYFGHKLVSLGERFLIRIPIAKTVYTAVKQILITFSGQGKSSFKKVILVEYPRKGIYSIGFLNGDMYYPQEDKCLLSVLVVTSVNPTSGFLILVPAEEAIFTRLSTEDAMKLIVSGGIVTPATVEVEPNPYLQKV